MSEDPNSFDSNANETPPTKSSNNRGFILAVSILGGIFLLALVAVAVVVEIILPRNRAQESTRVALLGQNTTATALSLTEEATRNFKTSTSTPVPPTLTATATPIPTHTATRKPSATATAVVAVATSTSSAILQAEDPRTATVAALLTEAAAGRLTSTASPASTALPTTGFVEDAGIPTLLGAALVLLIVIFLVRRLRASTSV